MTENPAYTIILSDRAEEDLRRLDKTNANRVRGKLKELAQKAASYPHTALKGKYSGLYRLRIGNYRAVYELFHEDQLIVVVRIGHRREVYEE